MTEVTIDNPLATLAHNLAMSYFEIPAGPETTIARNSFSSVHLYTGDEAQRLGDLTISLTSGVHDTSDQVTTPKENIQKQTRGVTVRFGVTNPGDIHTKTQVSYAIHHNGSPLLIDGNASAPELQRRIDDFYDIASGIINRAQHEVYRRQFEKKKLKESLQQITVEEIEQGQYDDIFDYHDSPKAQRLKESLREHKLKIIGRQVIRQDESPYYFSEPFISAKKHRPHVLLLHEEAGQIVPRIYYRSGSQLSWRWLPAKIGNWYFKGQSEHALDVPIVVQKSLDTVFSYLDRPREIRANSQNNPIQIIVPHFNEAETIRAYAMPATKYFSEQLPSEELSEGTNYDHTSPSAPNYDKKIDGWKTTSDVYGNTWIDVYHSNDGTIAYQIAHNSDGMAWVVHAEPTSTEIRPTLNADPCFRLGSILETPAFEYRNNAFTGATKPMQGHAHHKYAEYSDSFTYGIANHPLISMYYQTIPDDHFPWKTRFKDVPNWPAMRDFINAIEATASPENVRKKYAYELEKALAMAAKGLTKNQSIAACANQLWSLLMNLDDTYYSDSTPLDTTPTAISEADSPGGIFSVKPFEHPEVIGKLELLRQLGYTETERQIERHNPNLTRVLMSSSRFPDRQYVYEYTPEGVMNISAML